MLLLFGILQRFLESIDSKGDTLGDVTYEMVFFRIWILFAYCWSHCHIILWEILRFLNTVSPDVLIISKSDQLELGCMMFGYQLVA